MGKGSGLRFGSCPMPKGVRVAHLVHSRLAIRPVARPVEVVAVPPAHDCGCQRRCRQRRCVQSKPKVTHWASLAQGGQDAHHHSLVVAIVREL